MIEAWKAIMFCISGVFGGRGIGNFTRRKLFILGV